MSQDPFVGTYEVKDNELRLCKPISGTNESYLLLVFKRVIERRPDILKIDHTTFLEACYKKQGDQYKGYLVIGSGPNVRGAAEYTPRGGQPEVIFTLTPFQVAPDGRLAGVNSADEELRAGVGDRQLLYVIVRGKGLRRKPNEPLGQVYHFEGYFEGTYQHTVGLFARAGKEHRSFDAPVLVRSRVSYTGPLKPIEVKPAEPDRNERATARLNDGKKLAEAGDIAKARDRFEAVIRNYPETKAAAEARELLKNLKEK